MRRKSKRRANLRRTKQGLPDLEHVKSAVIVSLRSPESQRSYRRSIDDFVSWYCSEPGLSRQSYVDRAWRQRLILKMDSVTGDDGLVEGTSG
jgi:hypothetical protein